MPTTLIEDQDLLRIAVGGSVDHGKSSLVGRLLLGDVRQESLRITEKLAEAVDETRRDRGPRHHRDTAISSTCMSAGAPSQVKDRARSFFTSTHCVPVVLMAK